MGNALCRAEGAADVGEAAESADPPTQVSHLAVWPWHPQWGRVPLSRPRPAPAPPRGAGSGPAEAAAGQGDKKGVPVRKASGV